MELYSISKRMISDSGWNTTIIISFCWFRDACNVAFKVYAMVHAMVSTLSEWRAYSDLSLLEGSLHYERVRLIWYTLAYWITYQIGWQHLALLKQRVTIVCGFALVVKLTGSTPLLPATTTTPQMERGVCGYQSNDTKTMVEWLVQRVWNVMPLHSGLGIVQQWTYP